MYGYKYEFRTHWFCENLNSVLVNIAVTCTLEQSTGGILVIPEI